MRMSRKSMLASLMALGFATAGLAQPAPGQGAANAISDAVQEGSSPYRPPSADATSLDDAMRAKCEALKEQYNATSKQRSYKSSGPATQNAQGRTIPKIERDQTRKSLQETYRANCTH
ncbi:hypothetical protein [Cupriavidus sp. IDO]|uniref:hypothetical protein n=1 Tax=Cupriavidus sp. IDO TaxID=1539142 RepID=UPI0005790B11|nr:hypothetical protein [Cupriavidus sp. IDO]KWR77519.1 hypothetical protein RM96_31705 [Cupriavidus sp. IDO]